MTILVNFWIPTWIPDGISKGPLIRIHNYNQSDILTRKKRSMMSQHQKNALCETTMTGCDNGKGGLTKTGEANVKHLDSGGGSQKKNLTS